MTRSAPRSLFGSVTPPRIGNPLRTSAPASPMETQKKADPLLASQPKKKPLAPKPKQELGPFGALPGFTDGLGYTVTDRKAGIPNATAKKALDTDTAKLTRLHDMAKLTTLHDQIDGQLKQQAEAGLDLAAFDAKGTEIAQNALQNPMLDGPMRRKLTPMVEQMVGLHREGLRQRVIESHRQEADDIIAKSIERHDSDAMDIAARVGRSKPASVEREHLLQALVDKSRFIEDMRGVRTGIDDDTRASQREIYQQRLALAQHEAALEQAHGKGGEKAARAYLDALSKDLSIPEALRPVLARRLGIDIAHLEDRRRTKALRDARRQSHEVLSEFSQIRTGEPLAPFEDDHTDDDDMAAFRIWRAYDRWDRSPGDIPESAYRTLEHRYSDQRGAQEGELAHLAAQLEAWRADPNAVGIALDGRVQTVQAGSRNSEPVVLASEATNAGSFPGVAGKSTIQNGATVGEPSTTTSETGDGAAGAASSNYVGMTVSEFLGELNRDRDAIAEGRAAKSYAASLDLVGFDVIPDGQSPAPGSRQVTQSEYQTMLDEAASQDEWTTFDAGMIYVDALTNTKPTETSLKKYKDQWIINNAQTIKVISRRYGLPPELLAGIARVEVGGDPTWTDTAAIMSRGVNADLEAQGFGSLGGSFAVSPDKTSIGNVSIQPANIRKYFKGEESFETKDLIAMQRLLVENPVVNLDMVARHVSDMRLKAFPDSEGRDITDEELNALGWMWNAGYDQRVADDPAIVQQDNFKIRNNMGNDILDRWPLLKDLLRGSP